MTDYIARRDLRSPAHPHTIDDVHQLLDGLWADVGFVPQLDQMTFATAVIEAVTNVIQHAKPERGASLEIGVKLTVTELRLRAKISEYNARPHGTISSPALPGTDAESGRGLALIQALVSTVTVERRGDSNVWILIKDSVSTNQDS
ncbi:ATP-binding protein [Arthrobacter sp. H5]|uniref:ATP-binding protein n=1 Tax=Arthrobacter sp. H5 TaxID=1267973 RepID=UPI0004847018|nr:ATP-binding protein [Arthrobacter sp. H5]